MAAAFAAAAVTTVPARPGTPVPGQQFSPSTSFVDWVTGNFQPNNTFQRYGIWGTDVGVMWDNGIADDPTTPINEHQVLIAFGDTFGGPNMTGTWRLNTLFRSSDINLADGMSIPDGQWFNGNMFGGAPLWEPDLRAADHPARAAARGAARRRDADPDGGHLGAHAGHRVRRHAVRELHVGQDSGARRASGPPTTRPSPTPPTTARTGTSHRLRCA